MVARALLVRPRVVIADEPVSMIDASMRASVLGVLGRLHREQGISFVYVTHDLTTASQLCRTLVILYRGRTVEAGPAREIIVRPKHPYTRELVASVPVIEPRADYRAEAPAGLEEESGEGSGCAYLPRCSSATDECRAAQPPLFHSGSSVVAACWLYRRGRQVDDEDVCCLLRSDGKGASE